MQFSFEVVAGPLKRARDALMFCIIIVQMIAGFFWLPYYTWWIFYFHDFLSWRCNSFYPSPEPASVYFSSAFTFTCDQKMSKCALHEKGRGELLVGSTALGTADCRFTIWKKVLPCCPLLTESHGPGQSQISFSRLRGMYQNSGISHARHILLRCHWRTWAVGAKIGFYPGGWVGLKGEGEEERMETWKMVPDCAAGSAEGR
jgi:hypothetical protein